MTRLTWTLLKFLFGTVSSFVVGALPPEVIAWLSSWGEADEGEAAHRASIRHGSRRRSRRRAT